MIKGQVFPKCFLFRLF